MKHLETSCIFGNMRTLSFSRRLKRIFEQQRRELGKDFNIIH